MRGASGDCFSARHLGGKSVANIKNQESFRGEHGKNMDQMNKQTNIFKNFTDTVGFLGALFALVAVFFFKNEFVATETVTDYKQLETVQAYLFLAGVFVFSSLFGSVARGLPIISLAISCLPLCVCYQIFVAELLEKNPVFYIILTLIHASGALVYVFQRFEYEDVTHVREGRNCMISAYVLAVLAAEMWAANSFISIKYEKLLKLPFRYFLCVGIIGGTLGIVRYFLARRSDPENTPGSLFWNSLSSALVCAMILLARQTVGLFGI